MYVPKATRFKIQSKILADMEHERNYYICNSALGSLEAWGELVSSYFFFAKFKYVTVKGRAMPICKMKYVHEYMLYR